MKKFKNAFDYDPKDVAGERTDKPSMTVPEMTMSLKEILSRYTRGGEVATFTPVYQDNDEFDENPDFSKMDATEKLQYARQIKEAIVEHQKRAYAKQTERKSADDPPKQEVDQPSNKDDSMDSEKNPVKN